MSWWSRFGLLAPAVCLLAAAPVPRQDLNLQVPMRDGVRLSANLFRPEAQGPFPTILVRTPYDKGDALPPTYRAFVDAGYAVLLQDVRGRYDSGGTFDLLHQELADSRDTLDWIGRQAWSNRRIGMVGGSYLGIVQWKAATLNHPYLKAISPAVSGCDEYFDRFYSRGGAMKLGQRLEWMAENVRVRGTRLTPFRDFIFYLPLRGADRRATGRSVDFFQAALNHPDYDSFWRGLSTRERLSEVRIPVLSVGGWYDNFVESDLEAFHTLAKHGHAHRILIGPWGHNIGAELDGPGFGPEAGLALRALQVQWFDYWLKADGKGPAPAVARPGARLFVMGLNRWREEDSWPPAHVHVQPYYLAGGRANSSQGDGALVPEIPEKDPPDRFTYDPRNPVPTFGGQVCCNVKLLPPGPRDQRWIETRPDVLVFTGPELKHDLEVTGHVRALLYVSTSAPDTDFTAKLVDVYPDGAARILVDGILRLRYREGLEKPQLAKPGQIYPITISLGVTSNVFRAGHRIRLEVSSSNFPRFDRNPNTGRRIADERELRKANQTVYHDAAHPSHLSLPVIPSSGSGSLSAHRSDGLLTTGARAR